MSADPLDKQLVEAVLSRPRRAKADVEEAKMAGLRPSRPKAGVAVVDDDDDDDDDLDLGPEAAGEDGADVGIVVVADDGAVDPAAKLPADAPADKGAKALLTATPDFHLVKAGRDAQSDGTKERLKEAKKLVHAYNEEPTPDHFLTLLDWAFLAVHNGDLDSRDNVGLRAIWDWTREDVAFPALERWILAGNDAELLKRMGYDPEVPLNTTLRDRKGTIVVIGRDAREQL